MLFAMTVMAAAQKDGRSSAAEKPTPDIVDGKYGEHQRNTFDLWRPKAKKATPLVVFIHGGGFVNGDKDKLSASLLDQFLKNGYAVMSINYRLFPEVKLPELYMDAARAIQFARLNAKDWNIDKARVALTGSSAGALTALWIGFHDDLADPKNSDAVLRESTRVMAIAVFSAQTTLDPDVLQNEVGSAVFKHSFANGKIFGLKAASPELKAKMLESSPTTYLSAGDPPVWAMYTVEDRPMTEETSVSDAIHHPNFGKALKKRMDALKIECKLRHKNDGENVNSDLLAFFNRYLKK